MCKLCNKVIKETNEDYLGWRLEELHYEHYRCNGSKMHMNLIDLLDGVCTG